MRIVFMDRKVMKLFFAVLYVSFNDGPYASLENSSF